MQIIRLPRHLNELDLEALNQRLHANEIRLDWTDVEPNIPPTSLERLFAGMNLLDFIDAIGSDTMPERLLPEIQAAFAIVETQTPYIIANDYRNNESTPTLWLPEKSHAVLSPSPLHEPVEDVPILEAVPLVETDTPLPIQPTRPLLAAPSPAQMREELEEMVLRDLLGPAGGEDEEVDEDRM